MLEPGRLFVRHFSTVVLYYYYDSSGHKKLFHLMNEGDASLPSIWSPCISINTVSVIPISIVEGEICLFPAASGSHCQ